MKKFQLGKVVLLLALGAAPSLNANTISGGMTASCIDGTTCIPISLNTVSPGSSILSTSWAYSVNDQATCTPGLFFGLVGGQLGIPQGPSTVYSRFGANGNAAGHTNTILCAGHPNSSGLVALAAITTSVGPCSITQNSCYFFDCSGGVAGNFHLNTPVFPVPSADCP